MILFLDVEVLLKAKFKKEFWKYSLMKKVFNWIKFKKFWDKVFIVTNEKGIAKGRV